MALKPGYKQTEVGVIPEDWEVVEYNHIGQIIDGDRGVHYPSSGELKDTGYCLFLNAGNVTKSGFRFEDCTFITKEKDEKLNKGKLKRYDVVLTTRGTVGNFAYFDESVNHENVRINSGMVILRNTSKYVDTKYQYVVLRSRVVGLQIERMAFGSAQPQLTVKGINLFKIPLPPTIAEQTAIANALSDADALIQSLTSLIAKKRQIKQGAMQTLLNPYENGRLKEGWAVKKLSEIADPNIRWSFIGGPFGSNLKSLDYTKEGIRIIQLQNIGDGYFINDYSIYTSVMKADELISNNIYPGDIILSKMGDPVARACIIPNFHDRYLMCSDGIRLVADKNQCSNRFLFYYINSPNFRILAENASTGTTRKRIGLTELRNLEIKLPEITEQLQIAEILKAMDAEIAALETKLAKYRHIKQGMMQNLLTGKIRLI